MTEPSQIVTHLKHAKFVKTKLPFFDKASFGKLKTIILFNITA